MNKLKLKLLSAAVFAGCALSLLALRGAWATQGQTITTTILAGPVELDEIDIKSHSEEQDVKFKTNGFSDVYIVRNVLAPGGHTGWHSHPGPSIISVVSGQATEYHDDDPIGTVHAAGTAFVDDGDHVHIIRNEGTTDLELIAFQILPEGAVRRIDEPAP